MERWRALDARTRMLIVIGGPTAIYLLLGLLTGAKGEMRSYAPFGTVAVGVVQGTVIALGAMGIILVYRANRFINFAHGALGSMVGVIASAWCSNTACRTGSRCPQL